MSLPPNLVLSAACQRPVARKRAISGVLDTPRSYLYPEKWIRAIGNSRLCSRRGLLVRVTFCRTGICLGGGGRGRMRGNTIAPFVLPRLVQRISPPRHPQQQ